MVFHGIGRTLATALALGCAVAVGCARRSGGGEPTPPPAALLPTQPGQPGPMYRMQPGDELEITFPFQPEMNEQLPVRPDGRITLSTTGEMDVVGMTPTELERIIAEKSAARLRNPEVHVIITRVAERHVFVGGHVRKPGYVILEPNMTPLQAVVNTGGFQPTAKLDSVLLMTPGADGKFTVARMDMRQVVEDGVPERVRLHPGDIVYVPPTWISDMDDVVDQYVRGLIPALPRVGVGYSLSQ